MTAASVAVYRLSFDAARFAKLEVIGEEALDRFIDGFDTEPMHAGWGRVEVRKGPWNDELPVADFSAVFGGVPVLSARAVSTLSSRLHRYGELLPLESALGDLVAFNVTATADVMDEQASAGDWFEPGRLMDLQRLTGSAGGDPIPPIFKLPQWRKGYALVTREFLDAVDAEQLTGIAAREIGSIEP
jgi:hypothetical protein